MADDEKKDDTLQFAPTVQSITLAGQRTGATTTISTSVATAPAPSAVPASSHPDESFTKRLIEAVKAEPCLYNPNHEHYGNRQASSQYRSQVWQRLCVQLGFKDDPHALQMQWKRIRDRYVRERRKRRISALTEAAQQESNQGNRERHPSDSSNCSLNSIVPSSPSSRQFNEMMRWIEPFLVEVTPSVRSGVSSPNVVAQQQLDTSCPPQQQFNFPHGSNGGLVAMVVTTKSFADPIACYVNNTDVLKHETSTQPTATATDSILTTSFDRNSHLRGTKQEYPSSQAHRLSNGSGSMKPIVCTTSITENSSPSSSTSTEIDVETAATTYSRHAPTRQIPVVQTQAQNNAQQTANLVVLTPTAPQQQAVPLQQILFPRGELKARVGQSLPTTDGGVVTVTARGTAPIKKDVNIRTNDGGAVTMIIDPTTFYQHGSQKMYRLVNVSELSADMLASLNCATVASPSNEVKIISMPPQRRKRVAVTTTAPSTSNGRGQLGEELILDDGIVSKNVTIDQSAGPSGQRLLLEQPTEMGTSTSANILLSQAQVHHQPLATAQHHTGLSGDVQQASATRLGELGVRHQHHRQGIERGFVAQSISVHQPQYTVMPSETHGSESDLAFANSIATYLSRLNDDEKAVAKMNIQRILMDARFGSGASARMIHDDELNEGTSSHDVIASQRHTNTTSRR